MNLAFLNPFNKITDIISEVVTDKDLKNQLTFQLDELKHQMRMTELNTKTVPWVDAIHKIGRQLISVVTVLSAALLLHFNPDLDMAKMAAIMGIGAAPGGIYNLIKGRGK